jgi:dTDP-4-dehydrorhamnose 3,5-epimerase
MSGSIVDYAVDVNIHKSTIGEASCFVVKTGEYIEIPNTHAHGFLTLEPNTTILYFVDMSYCPEAEKYVLWQSVKEVKEDVESRIGKHSLTISAKDENAETLQSFIVNNPPMSWEDWLRSKNYSEQEIEVINKQQYPPKKIAK